LQCFLTVLCTLGDKPIPPVVNKICWRGTFQYNGPGLKVAARKSASGLARCGAFMQRFKLALGVVLLAGVLVAVAIAILNPFSAPHTMNEAEPTAVDRGRNGEGVANRERKNSAKATGSDSVIRDFVNPPGQLNPNETSSPRMQQKQIKMH
jgi:hypothetical protein